MPTGTASGTTASLAQDAPDSAIGKIVEHWGYQDQLGFVREIGAPPALATAAR